MAAFNQNVESLDTRQRLQRYIQLFKDSVADQGKMCLCGVLAAEVDELPESIKEGLEPFFQQKIDWLAATFILAGMDQAEANSKALLAMATLEGALLMVRGNGELALFDTIASQLLTMIHC